MRPPAKRCVFVFDHQNNRYLWFFFFIKTMEGFSSTHLNFLKTFFGELIFIHFLSFIIFIQGTQKCRGTLTISLSQGLNIKLTTALYFESQPTNISGKHIFAISSELKHHKGISRSRGVGRHHQLEVGCFNIYKRKMGS